MNPGKESTMPTYFETLLFSLRKYQGFSDSQSNSDSFFCPDCIFFPSTFFPFYYFSPSTAKSLTAFSEKFTLKGYGVISCYFYLSATFKTYLALSMEWKPGRTNVETGLLIRRNGGEKGGPYWCYWVEVTPDDQMAGAMARNIPGRTCLIV